MICSDVAVLRILRLAREIRRPMSYVGYSFFVILALLKQCRIYSRGVQNRVDLLETFAPWALESCTKLAAGDAVACCWHPPQKIPVTHSRQSGITSVRSTL